MVTRSRNIEMPLNQDEQLQWHNGNFDDSLQNELQFMLRNQRRVIDPDRDHNLNVYRSGSAPPTVDGSLTAIQSLFGNSNFFDIDNNNSININNNSSIGEYNSNSGSGCGSNVVLTEDEIRSHPAYLSYYYSHDDINPRLPPPLLSKEDWRVAQRFHAGVCGGSLVMGNGGELRKRAVDDSESSSLFSMQPGLSVQQAENDLMELRNAGRSNVGGQGSVEWLDRGSDGLIGLQGGGLGARRKSFADILQKGLDRPASFSAHLSRPASVDTFGEFVDTGDLFDPHQAALCNGMNISEQLHAVAALPGMVAAQNHGTTVSHSLASAMGSSLSRSTTPEQQVVGRSSSSGLPPVGSRVGPIEKKYPGGMAVQNGNFSGMTKLGDIAATFSGLSLSKSRHADQDSHRHSHLQLDLGGRPDFSFNMSGGNHSLRQQLIEKSNAENLSFSANYIDVERKNGVIPNLNASRIISNGGVSMPKRTFSSVNLHSKVSPPGFENLENSEIHHQNVNIPGSSLGASGIGLSLNRLGNQLCDPPLMDPHYSQSLQRSSDHRAHAALSSSGSQVRNYFGISNGDLDGIEKAYLEALLAQQKQKYEMPFLGKSGGVNHGHYKNTSHGLGMPYPGKPLANSVLSSTGPGTFQNDRVAQFNSMMKSSLGGSSGSWHSDIGSNVERRYLSSLLDEFKNNKARSFELSDIIDHVVEFSTDQYGSRFIQQKLETATDEEKDMIFPEILPHARSLMTDVFGNYVIQKFFELGTENQRTKLASHLTGHVLPLSLQMYGCRVIQKALEVVDVDQQTRMVAELDGSVMKCVRDQNGNHVIQKCIECVPEDRIQFIILSFYGQVVALSMHPYGCRVIQRVLEHCSDMNTQQVIMDEIMQSVCTLAQDQYGNYVIQHVLEHGEPDVRAAIIGKLAGQIVKMSQQKFASNVIERCLTFGGPEERQLLVNEILGSTDENEPLQAMMKDPFGNYVVQKVLETCDDQNLELILSRIKVHLNTLKRYTYGKHIVTRIEKLIKTGERRIGLSSTFTSQVV